MRKGILLLCVLLMGACATGPKMPKSLEDRAQARWDALLAGDWASAYAYLSPGFRSAMTSQNYAAMMQNRTIRWVNAEVQERGDCDESTGTCEVMVQVRYRVARGVPGMKRPAELKRGVVENWIEVDGAWYFVPDRLR